MKTTIRVCRFEDLASVAHLYGACFAEPPWYERFDMDAVMEEFTAFVRAPGVVFLVVESEERVVLGATIGFGLRDKPDILEHLAPAWASAFYVSEVFIDPCARGHGLAQKLVDASIEHARAGGYTQGVVRTSIHQPVIQHIFLKMGFEVLTRQQVVSCKQIEGVCHELPDERLLLGGPFL